MPWSNQGGGGQGPWGRPGGGGGGGGGPQPPNLDEILRRGQDRFRGMIPGGIGGVKGFLIIALIAVVVWLGTGFYRVQPDQQGVELIFGEWVDTTAPGLNYNLPSPLGTVYTPRVQNINRTQIGFRSGVDSGGRTQDVIEESLMLTGDENIIDIQFVVFWKIDTREPEGVPNFLFNIRRPEQTVQDAAESAMREIVGKNDFEFARTEGRTRIAAETLTLIQQILDSYGAGIEVTNVQIQKVDPPATVLDAFRDVQAARADKERQINEATGYSNEVVERAEGESQQIIRAAEAYREERIARAEGETARFLSVYNEFVLQREITVRRIYLQTMAEVFSEMDKVLIDNSDGGSGVVPYLPLDELTRPRSGTSTGAPQ